jgi:transposase
MSETLFSMPEGEAETGPRKRGAARMRYADRKQVLLRPTDLDSMLPEDHRARVVWEFVSKLDLTAFHDAIEAREGSAGRAPNDPAVMLSLWVFATLEGIGSARLLGRLCEEHDAYRWILGGLSTNYHALADFRTERAQEIDGLLTKIVALLAAAGAVTMERVAQDGMKVRASAGAPSFRRRRSLEECLVEAREQVAALKKEVEEDPDAGERRRRAAKERAARERQERVEEALSQWDEAASRREGSKAVREEKARVSTTDPDARVMKTADGGFRPCFNAQLATDVSSQVIVGVTLSNSGGDMGQMAPMLDDLERRHGRLPKEHLVDGGYSKPQAVEDAAARGVVVFAPVREADKTSPRRADDGPGVRDWLARMETEEGKAVYAQRPGTAECVNALARNRGLKNFLVRGAPKCLAVLTLFALAHNVMRAVALLG